MATGLTSRADEVVALDHVQGRPPSGHGQLAVCDGVSLVGPSELEQAGSVVERAQGGSASVDDDRVNQQIVAADREG